MQLSSTKKTGDASSLNIIIEVELTTSYVTVVSRKIKKYTDTVYGIYNIYHIYNSLSYFNAPLFTMYSFRNLEKRIDDKHLDIYIWR